MLVLFGSSQAFTLEDNVIYNFDDPFSQVFYNFRIKSLSASTCWPDQGVTIQYDSLNIQWPGNLENTWPIAHQVSGRPFLGNPEQQWDFINGDTSTLAVLPEYNNSVQFSCSVMSNTCDSMNHGMLGLPVQQNLPEFTQSHVHWVGDAIQPSHPLPSLFLLPQSFPELGSSQMCQLFTSGGQIIGVSSSASVFPMNTQDWSP